MAVSRLLLVGGGHGHLEILRRQRLQPLPVSLELISASPEHHYSGMVPGFVAGTYSEAEIAFDLQELTEAAGGAFSCERATAIDPGRQVVATQSGRELSYDILSLNVGSSTLGAESPSVRQRAQLVKPISRAVQLRKQIEDLAAGSLSPVIVTVVGAGAAGFEVACSCSAVLKRAGREQRVMLIDGGPEILSGYSSAFRRSASQIADRWGVEILIGVRVKELEPEGLLLSDGRRFASHLTPWLTGPAPPSVLKQAALEHSQDGFVLVDNFLRSVSHPNVLAVGDCATLRDYPSTPKAGVYAVREAPVLWHNLKAILTGGPLAEYRPQKGFLSILNSADGKALLDYRGLVSHSRWAFLLKDWIDRRFVRRYQPPFG